MKDKLDKLSAQLQRLEAFEEKYQPGGRSTCVHSLYDYGTPSVVFYGESDREWIISTFGAEGWLKSSVSKGWQHAEKMIDGVLVGFHQAHELEETNRNPKEIPAHLLAVTEPAQ